MVNLLSEWVKNYKIKVDDDLGIQEPEGSCLNKILDYKIEHAYFDISRGSIRLQKTMKDNPHPQNLAKIKSPKIYPDIKCPHHFQNNSSFVKTNEKSFYSTQN